MGRRPSGENVNFLQGGHLRKLLVLVLLLGFCAALTAKEEPVAKPENTCYTDSAVVEKGTSFPVRVFISNIDTLAGMQIPFYYRSENVNIVCDSVSFAGSRCSNFAYNDFKIEPVGKTVFFAFIFTVDPNKDVKPLLPGDGLVATLWFSAPKDTHSGAVALESGPNVFLPHPKIDYGYHFWTPAALEVDFAYKPGTISVK